MHKVIFALAGAAAGLLVGTIVGYKVAGKKYGKKLDNEIKSIKGTCECLVDKTKREYDKKVEELEKAAETSEKKTPADDGADDDEDEDLPDDDEDTDYGCFDGDEYERELKEARDEFLREVQEEYGTRGEAYNISEDVYNEPFPGFGKGTIMIDEDEDRAYDQDGDEIADWRIVIGDDHGTIDNDKKDEYGRIFVRCPRTSMDYEVTWSSIELAH